MRSELYKHDSPASPLLRTACHLVGSQSCDETATQNDGLYEQVKKQLSLVLLNPPLETSDLWAMLILSAWNLGPANSSRFIDSWLLSGSTLLYSSLTYGFSTRGVVNDYDFQNETTKSHVLAWNVTALLHLKYVLQRSFPYPLLTPLRFSVGTGKPCVFETDTLGQFAVIVRESEQASSDERSVAIELELYAALYKCVVQRTVQLEQTRIQFQQWKVSHDECLHSPHLVNGEFPADPSCPVLKRDTTLNLGYFSAVLILERWELAQQPVVAASTATTPEETVLAAIAIQYVVSRAIAVLEALQALTAGAHGTTPMYDTLLGTYAGVTLVQFADTLIDLRKAAELMRTVDRQRKSRLKSREPVLTWATDMMEKKALDLIAAGPRDLEAGWDREWLESGDRASFQWVPLVVWGGVDTNAASD
jgi:hypothetical protein